MNTMNMGTSGSQNSAAAQNTSGATDMKIDDRAIKKMAGEAISKVDGVLGVEGNLADMLKQSDDLTKGLGVTMSEDGRTAQISVKIVTEFGKNIPDIVNHVQDSVEKTVRDMAGITVDKVEVEVTDTMTREEYQAKTSRSQNTNQGH